MTRLHPDTIDAIKEKADIYEVVSEHVVLKKQGKDFVGLCPFHDDKRKPAKRPLNEREQRRKNEKMRKAVRRRKNARHG